MKKFLLISAGLLLIGIAPLPYEYYQFLRIAIPILMGICIFSLWLSSSDTSKPIFSYCVLGAIAIVFNPVVPVYSDKETWVVIDIICAVAVLLVFIINCFKNNEET